MAKAAAINPIKLKEPATRLVQSLAGGVVLAVAGFVPVLAQQRETRKKATM